MTYPELFNLLGAYFHYSWNSDYASAEAAVDAAVAESSRAQARALADEFDRILREHPTEHELIAVFDAEGSGLALEEGEHLPWFREVAVKARLRAQEG